MDIHHLRVFVSVYSNRSFSRASEALKISQPTISEHIKNLEEELGVRLFDRLARTIVPTREARLLYPGATSIIDDAERLKDVVSHASGVVRGKITIGASTIPGTYILPAMASGLIAQYPEVSFEILIEDSQKISDMVVNFDLVFGIVGAIMDKKRLDHIPFVEDELILGAPPALTRSGEVPLGDLRTLTFVMREEGSGTRKTVEQALLAHKADPAKLHVAATLGSTDAIKQAIKAGLGVSFLSRVAVREELARGEIAELKVAGLAIKRSFYLITHRKRSLSMPYSAFFEYLKGVAPKT